MAYLKKEIVFKYRYSPNFKSKVEDGKARICADNLKDEDIQRANKKSWIKFVASPTKYYSYHSLHATTEISLLICQFDQKQFSFSCAFAGVYAFTISSAISILLKNLVDLTLCLGYDIVSTNSSCIPRSVPEIEDDGRIFLKLRYLGSQCEIAYSYAGRGPNICYTCMRLHVHDQDSDKRKFSLFTTSMIKDENGLRKVF
ncbi:uncharacterized protein LOC120340043 [Styela clava]